MIFSVFVSQGSLIRLPQVRQSVRSDSFSMQSAIISGMSSICQEVRYAACKSADQGCDETLAAVYRSSDPRIVLCRKDPAACLFWVNSGDAQPDLLRRVLCHPSLARVS